LPEHAISADTTETGKRRLDKFRTNQDEYKVDLIGVANRSLVNMDDNLPL